MKQVRVENGRVVEVAPDGAVFRPGIFIEAANTVDLDWHYDDGRFTPPSAESIKAERKLALTWTREDARKQVDRIAEAERGRYLTPGDGQSLVYQAKAREAIRYTAADSDARRTGRWPYLTAEKGITARTLLDVARAIIKRAGSVDKALASIEATRLDAKAKIKAATTPEEVARIFRSMEFPRLD